MRNGALLVVLAGAVVLNGMFLDHLPAWRQVLFVALAIAAYLHGRRLPVRRGWLLVAVTALPAVVWMVPSPSTGVGALAMLGLFMVLPWLAGRYQRQQAELVARLALDREFAVLRERARIAADMHDSLGHDLALIALRAGGLELAPDMTEGNRDAATKLRESAVSATDRLRTTVHLLRDTQDSAACLIAGARDAGMTVRLHARRSLPFDDTLHRVIQESLTNAARHAPGAPVDIEFTDDGKTMTIKIKNPLPGTPTAGRPGSGLAGVHAQVALAGGAFEAAADAGTFTVTAHLPVASR